MSYKLFAAGLLATVGVIGTISAPAQAASLSCNAGTVTAGGQDYTACEGTFSGNDTGNKSSFLDDLNDGLLFQEVASWDNNWEWELS
ncbi:MAG: PEP-CTERM sorting domain-containing protein, partial [Cyanobacteriota bacterium]|nr:PEP-CTERM sorting domain-containing protein [Cyanobacteriota bacterium]